MDIRLATLDNAVDQVDAVSI